MGQSRAGSYQEAEKVNKNYKNHDKKMILIAKFHEVPLSLKSCPVLQDLGPLYPCPQSSTPTPFSTLEYSLYKHCQLDQS